MLLSVQTSMLGKNNANLRGNAVKRIEPPPPPDKQFPFTLPAREIYQLPCRCRKPYIRQTG